MQARLEEPMLPGASPASPRRSPPTECTAKGRYHWFWSLTSLHTDRQRSRRYYVAAVSFLMFVVSLQYVNGYLSPPVDSLVLRYLLQLVISASISVVLFPVLLGNYSDVLAVLVFSALAQVVCSVVAVVAMWDVQEREESKWPFRVFLIVFAIGVVGLIVRSPRSYHNKTRREQRRQLTRSAFARSQVHPRTSKSKLEPLASHAEIAALHAKNADLAKQARWLQLQILQNANRVHEIQRAEREQAQAEREREQQEAMASMNAVQRLWERAKARFRAKEKPLQVGLAALVGDRATALFSPEESCAQAPDTERHLQHRAITVVDAKIATGLVLGILVTAYLSGYLIVSASERADRIGAQADSMSKVLKFLQDVEDGTVVIVGTKPDFSKAISLLSTLHRIFRELSDTYVAAAVTGVACGMFCVLASTRPVVRAYKAMVIKLRRGLDADIPKIKQTFADIKATTVFIGVQTSSAATAYVVVWFVVWLCVVLLGQTLFRDYLKTWREYIISYVVLLVIQAIVDFVAEKTLIRLTMCRNPNWWFMYEHIMMFFKVISGAYAALTRLCYILLYVFASLFRLDYTVLPEMFQSFDSGFVAFNATAVMEHTHRNPLLDVASQLLASRSGAVTRSQKRWWLASMLVRNPLLANLRRHNRVGNSAAELPAEPQVRGRGQAMLARPGDADES